MAGLCKRLMVSFSGHEVCTDECRSLVLKLRAAGVGVTCDELPHLPHVLARLADPGGQEGQERTCRICAHPRIWATEVEVVKTTIDFNPALMRGLPIGGANATPTRRTTPRLRFRV